MPADDLIDQARERLRAGEPPESVIRWLGTEAFRAGAASTIGEFMSAEDAAATLGISSRTLRQLAVSRGLGNPIGEGRRAIWLFHKADLDALRDRRRGRPPKPKPEPAPAEEPPKPTRSRRTTKGDANAAADH